MKQVVVFAQWVNFILIICEMCAVFKKMRKRAHYYLFMNCIALVLYSVGSLLMLYVVTDEAYYISLMMSWAGKIGVVVSMLFFCKDFFGYKLPIVVTALESGISAITYIIILTTKKTGLFYKDLQFVEEKGMTIIG